MRSKLKIYTSHLDKNILGEVKNNNEYLPIFAIKNIKDISMIKRYHNASIHIKQLAPSDELLGKLRNNTITHEEFEKLYVIELSRLSIQDIIKKLEYLAELNNTKGVVIICSEDNYGKALSMVLNYSKLLLFSVKEYDCKR